MTLTLAPDAAIDLQLHTVHSDGEWTAVDLLDYLTAEKFSLGAITDHDRVDTVRELLRVAAEKQFPLLPAVEMSAMWQEQLTDFLCYGFDPEQNHLDTLAQDTTRRQRENTRQVFEYLQRQGYAVKQEELEAMLAKPAAQQLPELFALAGKHIPDDRTIGPTLLAGGFAHMTQEPAKIVEAAHQSGAVCILAHPGRSDGFVCYDRPLLDALHREANIDGIEVYYPLHTPEQTNFYLEYAAQHNLLVSAGSDSHGPAKPPVKYPAANCRRLLEHLDIEIR